MAERGGDRVLRWVAPLLLLTFHLYFSGQYARWGNPNEYTRVYHLLALVDTGHPEIDAYLSRYGDIQDKAAYGGHFYSDKAPGVVLQLLPVGFAARAALGPDATPRHMKLVVRVAGLSLPMVVLWWGTRRYWRDLAGTEALGWAVILAGALGTLLFIYSTQLFGHAFAAAHLFLGFLSIRRAAQAPDARRWLALAGFCCALALTCDYVVAFSIPVLTLYAASAVRGRWATFLWFPLGAAVPVGAWMLNNWACFEHPFRLASHYLDDPVTGPFMRRGWIGGISTPQPDVLWPVLVGARRGVLYLSPVLLLAPVGWWWLARDAGRRAEALTCAGVVGAILAFVVSLEYWHANWAVGVRYFAPAIPFCLVGVARAVRDADAASARAVLFRGAAVVGLCTIGLAAATFPSFPSEYSHPLFQFAWPLYCADHVMPSLLVADPWWNRLAFTILVGLAATVVLVGPWPTRRGLTTGLASLVLAIGMLVAQYATTPRPGPVLRSGVALAAWRLGYIVPDVERRLGFSSERGS